MKININSIAFTLRNELSDFIKNKVKKLNRFYRDIISIEVALKVDKSGTRDNKICRVRLIIPGNDLISGARGRSFEAAVAQVIKALEKQIEKRKTKAGYSVHKRPAYNLATFIS